MWECPRCDNDHVVLRPGGDHVLAERCACRRPCPTCAEVGFRFEPDPRGNEVAVACACQAIDRRARLVNEARLPGRYASATFKVFETPTPAQATLRKQAHEFAQGYVPGSRGILYYGTCGTGKTHLVVAILRHLLVKRGVPVRFVEFMHLLSDLRESFERPGRTAAILNTLVQVPVLAIDELGKGRGTEWELSVLDDLISKRYNAGRTILFTTNYFVGRGEPGQPGLEERVGARIYSRLMEMCQLQLVAGEDYRRRVAAGVR